MLSAEIPVQRQLEAYNDHDLARFIAEYADDVQVFRPPATLPVLIGRQALAAYYATHRFSLPALRATLVKRIVAGRIVVDHETIAGLPDGERTAIVVYEVVDGLIQHVWLY